jgi:dTDP-4-amino-4,6-dideoxygalactose transaminase
MGDASVISFGAGKLLDCGGGGAVLTDDEKLYVRCQEVAKTLPADPVYRRAQYAACMKAMFLLHREKKEEVEFCRCRDELKRQYKDGYLSALAPASAATIGERLPELEKLSERRRVLAHELESVLKDELEIQLPIVQGGWVPWRYSFLVQGDRENWCKRFAAAGLAASRHFKPLHQEFPQPSETFPVATEISQKIINIDLLDAEQVRCGLKNIFIGEPCLIAR